MDMLQHHQATMTEALQKLLISPREVELAVQQHNSGGNDAYELMRVGQEVVSFSSWRVTILNQILA